MDFNIINKLLLNFRNTPNRLNLSNTESQINSTSINNPFFSDTGTIFSRGVDSTPIWYEKRNRMLPETFEQITFIYENKHLD